jgi:hypothetical protein
MNAYTRAHPPSEELRVERDLPTGMQVPTR